MLRLFLFLLLIFLIIRIFVVYSSNESTGKKNTEPEIKNPEPGKGVSKSIGEYVDYEEVD